MKNGLIIGLAILLIVIARALSIVEGDVEMLNEQRDVLEAQIARERQERVEYSSKVVAELTRCWNYNEVLQVVAAEKGGPVPKFEGITIHKSH